MQRLLKDYKEKIKGKVFSDPSFKPFGEFYNNPKEPLEVRESVKVAYISTAEKMLEEEIPMLTLSAYREYEINGNRNNFQKLFFKR